MVDDDELIANLKRDLQDGDDLATAVALVSDAVQRRIRRVQRSLDMLSPDDPVAAGLQRRLQSVLDRYEQALGDQGRALRRIVDECQPELDDLAESLDDPADNGG